MQEEFKLRDVPVKSQMIIPIEYKGLDIEALLRCDFLVDDQVVVELKSVEKLVRVHYKQVLTYLRLGNKRLGLLVKFGSNYIKDGIHRIVNGLPDEA